MYGQNRKTHSGGRSEFARLARRTPAIDRSFSVFLAKAYKYKEISDYGVGHGAVVSMAEADDAVRNAVRFIDCMTTLLAEHPQKDVRQRPD
jgi:uncharacterized protein (UPF0332 family)